MTMKARVLNDSKGNINNPEEVGKQLAKKLKLQGADKILSEIFEQFRMK